MIENPMINYKENEPKVVAHCCNCNEELTEQDLITKYDNEYFCEDSYCFLQYMGVEVIEGWEINE